MFQPDAGSATAVSASAMVAGMERGFDPAPAAGPSQKYTGPGCASTASPVRNNLLEEMNALCAGELRGEFTVISGALVSRLTVLEKTATWLGRFMPGAPTED